MADELDFFKQVAALEKQLQKEVAPKAALGSGGMTTAALLSVKAKPQDVPALLEIAARGFEVSPVGTEVGKAAFEAAFEALKPWSDSGRGIVRECVRALGQALVLRYAPMPMMADKIAEGRVAAKRLRAGARFVERILPVVEAELSGEFRS